MMRPLADRRALFALGTALAAAAAIPLVDLRAALALGEHRSGTLLDGFVRLADLVTLHGLDGYLPGAVLLVAAALLALSSLWRPAARKFAFTGSAILASALITDLLKPPFGRKRPFQALAEARDQWFAGSDYGSFPSGHAAFYAAVSLVVLALLPQRWPLGARLLALVPALLISAQRVLSLDHYVGDVLAGWTIALGCVAVAQRLWSPGQRASA